MNNTEGLLQRASMLISQRRPEQAAEQLRQLLAADPNVAEAHALLALCMSHDRDQWHDATREAEQAIHLAPDNSLSHYALAIVLQNRQRLDEALVAAKEAIRLAPESCQSYGLAASILAQQAKWNEALEAATQGMEIDPDDDQCASIRSLSLERLGRTRDAMAEADAAVARNPDSAQSHSMRGWTQLQNGDHRAAQVSFREALRLDPTDEFARSGMIEALNSNHLLFRLVFRFYSFMGRLAESAQWAIILGLFFGMRILRSLADQYPWLGPYVMPISILYLGFVLLSWIATPLFNTFLRFHPFGKFLLSQKQKWASNAIAACIMIGVAGGMLQMARGDLSGGLLMFLLPVFLTLPLSTAFEVDMGWPLTVTIGITIVLGLFCLASLFAIVAGADWGGAVGFYLLGIMVFSFAGNYLRTVTVRH